jgi:putative transposase
LLTPTRDRDAAEAFLHKAIRTQLIPEKITIDQSGSNTAAIKRYNRTHKTNIAIRQCKYLNNIVEQDHRAVKRQVRPMLGFKSFWAARCTLAGIEGSCTPFARDNWTPPERCLKLPQSSSMHWLHR